MHQCSKRPARILRKATGWFWTVAALAGAVAAKAEIYVFPDTLYVNTPVFLHLVADDAPDSPTTRHCVAWTVSIDKDLVIHAEGRAQTSGPCPPIVQEIPLGHLPAGHYRVDARIVGEPGIFNEVSFDVRVFSNFDSPPIDFHLSEVSPRPQDAIELTLSTQIQACETLDWSPPRVSGDEITIDGHRGFLFEPCDLFSRIEGHRFLLPPLSAGVKTITVTYDSALQARKRFTVAPDPTVLAVRGGAYLVSLRWGDANGQAHDAFARRLTDESGEFWFFDRDNTEVTVKVLDGRAVNGKIWVFAASMTDVAFTLDVLEQTDGCGHGAGAPPCRQRTYSQALHANRNILDTGAF